MNVARLGTLILEELGKLDQEFTIDERVVMAHAEVEMNDMIRQLITAGQPIPEGYFKPFVIPITVDSITGYKVAKPSSPPAIIGKEWCRQIGPTRDMTVSYTTMTQGQLAQVNSTEVANNGGMTGAIWSYGQWYFINLDPLVSEVRALYIPQLSLLVDEDDIFGDSTIEKMIIANTVNSFRYKKDDAKVPAATDNVTQR